MTLRTMIFNMVSFGVLMVTSVMFVFLVANMLQVPAADLSSALVSQITITRGNDDRELHVSVQLSTASFVRSGSLCFVLFAIISFRSVNSQ